MATPDEIIEAARLYADRVRDDARREVDNARNRLVPGWDAIRQAIPSRMEMVPPKEFLPPDGLSSPPDYEWKDLVLPSDPTDHEPLDPIPPYVSKDAPVFEGDAPRFDVPSKPTELEGFKASLPVQQSVVFPEPPSELESPQLQPVRFGEYAVPTRPPMTLPTQPDAMPVFEGQEPGDLSDQFERKQRNELDTLNTLAGAYVDQMISKFAPNHKAGMAELEGRLEKYMKGGTALSAEVEDAIYRRAQERNDREAERVQRAAFSDVAARGFTLPTGTLAATLARARMEAASNNSKAASDIAVAQAELEQRNIQFAVTASAALRTTVLNMTQAWLQGILAINGQALDSAKAVMAAVIEAYNVSVKVYTTKLEAWRAEVAMFDSKINFELSKVEVYKAEIQALEAAYSVDQMKVDQYKAEVSRLSALADLYKSRIDAVMGKVTLEKAKVEVFQVQAQAYASQVQAKQAEWQAFSAEIGGHTADVQAYNARASAFASEVQAYKTEIDAKVAEINATAAKNNSIVDAYKARVQSYAAAVQAESASNSANIENEKNKGINYKWQLDQESTRMQLHLDYQRSEAARVLEEAKQKFASELKKAEIAIESARLEGGFAEKTVDMYAGVAQAALSGLNVLAATSENL